MSAPGDIPGALARSALAQYELQDASFELVKKWQNKHLFRVAYAGEDYLLRAYAPPHARRLEPSFSEQALRSKLIWMEALRREAGLRVPEPVRASGDALTVQASAEELPQPHTALLLRWVPGTVKTVDTVSAEDLYLFGQHAARLHRHAESYAHPEGFFRPRWDWNRLFGERARLWRVGRRAFSEGEMRVFAAIAERSQRDLGKMGKSNKTYGIVHRDLQPENIVFDGGGAAAIDFEGCGWSYYMYDLAVMLLRLEERGDDYSSLKTAMLEGYTRVRPLPPDHQRLLRTFVAMRIVDKVTVALRIREPAKNPQSRAYLTNAVTRLEEILAADPVPSRSMTSLLKNKFKRARAKVYTSGGLGAAGIPAGLLELSAAAGL